MLPGLFAAVMPFNSGIAVTLSIDILVTAASPTMVIYALKAETLPAKELAFENIQQLI
jgi:hypothetical protein